ncbi:hypothetical protein [Methanobrevibacter olleyae]|uniref:Uncharacterized protein n=2 Tax=Methanobrevibacter olleyae TaxID=294671 RepID=A0A126R1M0_METOL|nr:hypothetical protein [Methanobrevibacter olleyae]AMK15916.1 hypothetical protein YLM1_1359 [Methanobrevibacter olleyae]SFL15339.1 hypothetical protein SAMN02910297_00036 [Methanobrevibacter olleyae]
MVKQIIKFLCCDYMVYKESGEKRVTIVIDKSLDYKFRKMASQKFKFEPKWYSKAMEEAVNLWIEENIDEDFE